jgi:hypothetical protein
MMFSVKSLRGGTTGMAAAEENFVIIFIQLHKYMDIVANKG